MRPPGRDKLNVVGLDQADWHDDHVHTIDVWYSDRRKCWIVERLNAHGSLVGAAHQCPTLHDAEDCLAEWLRSHNEAHVTAAREHPSAPEGGVNVPTAKDGGAPENASRKGGSETSAGKSSAGKARAVTRTRCFGAEIVTRRAA